MKKHQYNDYQVSGIVLLSAALLLLLAASILNRSDITSATLFLCGVTAFLGGIFLMTFSKPEPVDANTASVLTVMGAVNISRMVADMGVKGKAWFIPGDGPNPEVMEFIPVSDGLPSFTLPDFSFVIEGGQPGVRLIPDAVPLLDMLRDRHGYHAPRGEDESFTAIKEISEDILEFCSSAEVSREGDSVIVRIKGYRLYRGCRYVDRESRKICTTHPCGICSLAACILAEGLSIPMKIDHIDMDDTTHTLRIIMASGP